VHAISSYRGNRATHAQTHLHTHTHTHPEIGPITIYTAPQLASEQYNNVFFIMVMAMTSLRVKFRVRVAVSMCEGREYIAAL